MIRRPSVLALVILLACGLDETDDPGAEQPLAPGEARSPRASSPRGRPPRLTLAPGPIAAETGSLIIPMDTTYQNLGTFRAFGLVYELLVAGVPVGWAIAPGKAVGAPDFTASATDNQTGAAIVAHGYRAGPWVIEAVDAPAALPIVQAWQVAYPTTTVHIASAPFVAEISRYLIAAPSIAMFADGNQAVARTYMQAAHIPDSAGNYLWPDNSPDMLTVAEVAGPSLIDHQDGALFDADGDPNYCQLMSMHWGVNSAQANPGVVAEVRSFLQFPTHFFAECQAVNAFENLNPHGFFLTTTGFVIDSRPQVVDVLNADQPFVQFDGTFGTVGGSEPSYSIPAGGAYKAGDVVMLTGSGTPVGVRDVWMTGYIDGACPPEAQECGTLGKVSYLGGHSFSTSVPISTNPNSQGTRLFLNSLFEAPCATSFGHPNVFVQNQAPAQVVVPQVDYSIDYTNFGPTVASSAQLVNALPAGATFISACCGGQLVGNDVVWELDNLGVNEGGIVTFSVALPDYGTYDNAARVDYYVGLTPFSVDASLVSTVYMLEDSTTGSEGTTTDAATTLGDDGSAGGADSTASGTTSGEGGGGASSLDGTAGHSGVTDSASRGEGSASVTDTAPDGAEDGTGGSVGFSDDGGSGCGCRETTPTPAAWAWLLLGLGHRRRRQCAAS